MVLRENQTGCSAALIASARQSFVQLVQPIIASEPLARNLLLEICSRHAMSCTHAVGDVFLLRLTVLAVCACRIRVLQCTSVSYTILAFLPFVSTPTIFVRLSHERSMMITVGSLLNEPSRVHLGHEIKHPGDS